MLRAVHQMRVTAHPGMLAAAIDGSWIRIVFSVSGDEARAVDAETRVVGRVPVECGALSARLAARCTS